MWKQRVNLEEILKSRFAKKWWILVQKWARALKVCKSGVYVCVKRQKKLGEE